MAGFGARVGMVTDRMALNRETVATLQVFRHPTLKDNTVMIHILWDASDIWGPLAVWGVKGLGAPYKLVRGKDVADGALQRATPAILLVPGGFGRHKARALGEQGREAVRAFVAGGGAYVGFCGGAGLALADDGGLALCPWRRSGYANRIQHYMSGHFYVSPASGGMPDLAYPGGQSPGPLLPVWWPGRFAPRKDGNVTVLASYGGPGPDFWLADMPVAALPPGVFADWEQKYGFSPSPSFLRGEPCVISGTYGKGRYVLTYSHLETPESAEANAWLAHILARLGGGGRETCVPAWNLRRAAPAWDDPGLAAVWDDLNRVLDTGVGAGLFFDRSSWLIGWRTGIPGAVLNTVRAHLHTVRSIPPSPAALRFWNEHKEFLTPALHRFADGAQSYLLAERLAMTLAKDPPEALAPDKLLAERTAVFGASGMAAHAGGMLGGLLPFLDELARLQLQAEAVAQ